MTHHNPELHESFHGGEADLRAVDEKLRRQPTPTPPDGLAERTFQATVDALPRAGGAERSVAGRIGSVRWWGWRVAAAIGLVFVFVALWTRPDDPADTAVVDTTAPAVAPDAGAVGEADLAEVQAVAEAMETPASELDARIEALAMELDAVASELRGGPMFAADEQTTLADDLYEIDRNIEQELF